VQVTTDHPPNSLIAVNWIAVETELMANIINGTLILLRIKQVYNEGGGGTISPGWK
jgi:hypothetical protein